LRVYNLPEGANYPYEKSFTWVLVLVCLLVIQYAMTMYVFTMRARISAFNKEFMSKFNEEHAAAFPERPTPPKFGYPDTGNGYYGKKLPYKAWYDMNNGQRAQMNFLEQITFVIGISLIAGFTKSCTWVAVGFLAVYSVGRLMFSLGYTKAGPNARLPGAILMDIALLGQFITAIVAVTKIRG